MRNSKRIKIVAGGTAVLFGVGVAFAAWTSTGEGTGTVTAGEEAGLTVEQTNAAAVTGLFPTDTKAIDITVTNDNVYGVTVASLVGGPLQISGGAGCTPENAAVVFADEPTLSDYLAPSASETYTLDVSMGADSYDGCQNAVFSVLYTANAASSDAPSTP